MRLHDLRSYREGSSWISSVLVEWEDADYPEFRLFFEIGDPADHAIGAADAFASACFPLAAVHCERRLHIEGAALCPMLAEGLKTVHGWWRRWGGMPKELPVIEARSGRALRNGTRMAISPISGGVDSLHTLFHNRETYRESDPAYIRTVLFVHGYDIGKRAKKPETALYEQALSNLAPLAEAMGARLLRCRTNLRDLPAPPGFWTFRHVGPALAAIGHAAATNPAFVFIAGAYTIPDVMPLGAHPATDNWYSSQDVAVIADGGTFSRVDKLRDLARWSGALDHVRVCPANVGKTLNCGICAACIHTRLELLGLGIEYTEALGESLVSPQQLDELVRIEFVHEAVRYRDILTLLKARGWSEHCRIIEAKLACYGVRGPMHWSAPGCARAVQSGNPAALS
jgi:hypothetical protein